jgi:hypothetical protein
MRNSAVPDPSIREILGVDVSTQTLDRWEKPFREPSARRDRGARAQFGYATRRLRATGRRSTADDLDPSEADLRTLRSMIAFLEAIGDCFRAEEELGVSTDWLPLYMRDDPYPELELAIEQLREQIEEIHRGRRTAATERIAGSRRSRAMTTTDYGRLSAAERAQYERDLGLDVPPVVGVTGMPRVIPDLVSREETDG